MTKPLASLQNWKRWYGHLKLRASEWLFSFRRVELWPQCAFSRRPNRFAKNAPGDFYTTGECLACGVPEDEAPECLAALDDSNSDTYFVRQPATPEETEKVCQAAKMCCADAIRYAGKDENIMRLLGPEYCDRWMPYKP